MTDGFLGVVCGLKSEASTLNAFSGHPRVQVGISGASADRARTQAARLVSLGAKALVSYGVSGGLDKSLEAGDLILARDVVEAEAGTRYTASNHFNTCTLARLDAHRYQVTTGTIVGSNALIDGPGTKKKLAKTYGALAVDMESHAVAEVAQDYELPFIAFRAIADPVCRRLPSSAANAVAPDGSVRTWDVLRASLARPTELGDLISLGADSQSAHKALRRCAGHFIPTLLGIMHIG